ncbi:unnamed protein product [Gongylonema pulchrum]|uniref:Girdin-like n=1 Tax=Gongylonema pulchrum TaxID=637853 RepID=A0A183DUF0_9BILA|nr:unnamed protein product [Gongylonema pulchrum]
MVSTAQQHESEMRLGELVNEISVLKEEMVEKEKGFTSMRGDLESKYQKMLAETKRQYEQKIAELSKNVDELKASENEKVLENECNPSEHKTGLERILENNQLIQEILNVTGRNDEER